MKASFTIEVQSESIPAVATALGAMLTAFGTAIVGEVSKGRAVAVLDEMTTCEFETRAVAEEILKIIAAQIGVPTTIDSKFTVSSGAAPDLTPSEQAEQASIRG